MSTLANVAEIIGAGTIITNLIFGWIQIRYYGARQWDAVAINLMQTLYNQGSAQSIALLRPLPDGISLDEKRAKATKYVEAAIAVTTSFDTIGLLVFKRIATFDPVIDLAGGFIKTMARKSGHRQNDMREAHNQLSRGEWSQPRPEVGHRLQARFDRWWPA